MSSRIGKLSKCGQTGHAKHYTKEEKPFHGIPDEISKNVFNRMKNGELPQFLN
jgi:hypothetical protein